MPTLTRTENFSNSSRYYFTPGQIEIASGAAQLVLPETSGSIIINEVFEADGYTSLTESVTKTGSDNIKYILIIDGISKYYNGSSWANSDGTFSQASTASQINSGAGTAPLSANGSQVQIKVVFSGSGTTTPSIDSLVFVYSYDAVEAPTPSTCRVHASLKDVLGSALDTTPEGILCVKIPSFSNYDAIVPEQDSYTAFDSNGFAELIIPETETANVKCLFEIRYVENHYLKIVKFSPCVVPDYASVNLTDITYPI